jgi:protein-S-isoprenylcysteine O-methyltransferase Ste14
MIFWITHFLAFGYFAVEIFLLTRRRSHDPKHQSDRGTLGLIWILIFGSCVIGFWLTPLITFLNWPESLAIVLTADVLLTAGIAFRIWSIVHLGKFFTVDVAIQEGQRVVQDGPYRFVRHPSYSGSMIALLGLALLTFNWLGFFLIIGCSFLAFVLRISVEEKALLQSLGEEYRRYAGRTKRLIPGIY